MHPPDRSFCLAGLLDKPGFDRSQLGGDVRCARTGFFQVCTMCVAHVRLLQDQQGPRALLRSRTESGLGAESFDKDKKLGGGCAAKWVLYASALLEMTA